MAENLNTHPDFAEMPRDQKSVRERFNKRFKDFKAKLAKEEKASGINVPPPTEVETLMEEIKELMDSHMPAPSKKADSERKKGLKLRGKSMTTCEEGKSNDDEESTESSEPRRKRNRRKASDPLEYLSTRREEEMDLKRQQMELEAKRIEIEKTEAGPAAGADGAPKPANATTNEHDAGTLATKHEQALISTQKNKKFFICFSSN